MRWMVDLENYRIETDRTVLLSFRDGRKVRVRADRLPRYLHPKDVAVVRRALRLRRDFLRFHMPKAALVFLAAGLLVAALISARTVAWLLLDKSGNPTHTSIVRSQTEPQAPADPAPTSPAATPKLAGHHHTTTAPTPAQVSVASHVTQVLLPAATPVPLAPSSVSAPDPAPSATPAPSSGQSTGTTSDQPASTPAPSPTPAASDSGQVLGAATGPQ